MLSSCITRRLRRLLRLSAVLGALAPFLARGQEPVAGKIPEMTAAELLAACVNNLPRERLLLGGTLSVRRQRGIVETEYSFKLDLDLGANPATIRCDLFLPGGTEAIERAIIRRQNGRSRISLFSGPGLAPQPTPSLAERVRGTDMTWLDLTLDFLWWPDARLDGTGSVLGRDCHILIVTPPTPVPGCSAIRLWIDRRLHFPMQAEQLDSQGRPVRRMWVQRIRKIDERWMIRNMEIETIGGNHRTRLFVDNLKAP